FRPTCATVAATLPNAPSQRLSLILLTRDLFTRACTETPGRLVAPPRPKLALFGGFATGRSGAPVRPQSASRRTGEGARGGAPAGTARGPGPVGGRASPQWFAGRRGRVGVMVVGPMGTGVRPRGPLTPYIIGESRRSVPRIAGSRAVLARVINSLRPPFR